MFFSEKIRKKFQKTLDKAHKTCYIIIRKNEREETKMKELYRVQYMSEDSYNDYMNGGYNYCMNDADVLAESGEEAREIIQQNNPHMVVNDYVRKVAEIEAEKAAWKAEREAKEKKEAEKKAAKAKWEAEHPEEVAEKKRQANIKRYKRLIEKQKEEIAKQQEELAYLERKLKELEG